MTEAMDVFSVGCVIAELFLEGKDTFTLSQLFKYRSGDLSMEAHLASIEDEGVRVSKARHTSRILLTNLSIVHCVAHDICRSHLSPHV